MERLRRALNRGDEGEHLCCAVGDTIGEVESLNPIVPGQEIVRNNQLILGGESQLKVNTLSSRRQKVRGSQIGEGHRVLVDDIRFVVNDGLDGTTPDNHISIISLTTDKGVAAGTGDQSVASTPSMKRIMTSTTIKDVIAIATMKGVVAIAPGQCIMQNTSAKKIVPVKPVDSVGHVIKATKRVMSCSSTTHHDSVAKMAIQPGNAIGKPEGFNAVSLRNKIVLHLELTSSGVAQDQMMPVPLG